MKQALTFSALVFFLTFNANAHIDPCTAGEWEGKENDCPQLQVPDYSLNCQVTQGKTVLATYKVKADSSGKASINDTLLGENIGLQVALEKYQIEVSLAELFDVGSWSGMKVKAESPVSLEMRSAATGSDPIIAKCSLK
ncbi:MAG: hypothetical protein V4692_10920 [Bdellovibrionota bacterium]